MKKVLMSVALLAAVAAGYMMTGSNESEVNMSELAQANVEALADGVNTLVGCNPYERAICIVMGVPLSNLTPVVDKNQ
ncbi:MAG: hypothetical protein J6U14_07975 [Bacteroidaceae bacterium]|nr:hypothetical protein [Bacteroidaceae bacterium]